MKITLIYIISCISVPVLSAPPSLEPFFRSDYTFSSKQQAFYKVHLTQRKWVDARNLCHAEGALLLIPTGPSEVKFVSKLMNEEQLVIPNYEIYMGIHDMFTEGTFVTITGEDIDIVYNVWKAGEPNDQGGGEDCVVLDQNGEYSDVNCTLKKPFVCKKSAKSLTTNADCYSSDLEYFPDPTKSRCYKLHLQPKTWYEAYQICHAEQSYLAVLNNANEAQFLKDKFVQHPEDKIIGNFYKGGALLGFHDMFSQGDFITVHGKTLAEAGYTNWEAGQPDNAWKNEHCGMMFRSGRLNDFPCNEQTLFFCEKDLYDVSLIGWRFKGNNDTVNKLT